MTTPAPLESTLTDVYSYRHVFDDIDGVIRNFTPLAPPRLWNEAVQEFTRSAVTEMQTKSEQEARFYMSTLSGLVIWSVNIACLPLTRESVLIGSNIDAYIRKGVSNISPVTQRLVRLRLLRVSAQLVDYDPERRDAGPKFRAETFAPYKPSELARFRNQGATRSTAVRRHNWMTLLALGAGFALNTTEIIDLPASRIESTPNGLHVRVGGKKPRTVTCLASWEEDVRRLLESPLAGQHLFHKDERPTTPALYAARFINTVANEGAAFKVERLRSTWIVEHINARTPVFALMHALGSKSLSSLERLERFAAVPDDATLTAAFRMARA
ncbi:hypothetical protein ABIE21_003295 [Conyzicola nivalis]|uniref:Tyr recombinase domain-containing protein n=1 Tax=Conyzicola nivalis TaxID=1477021 RepID=A0ABV2QRQ8_9MICO